MISTKAVINIAYIPLSGGQLAIVDLDDVPLLLSYYWIVGKQRGTTRSYARARYRIPGRRIYEQMHRIIIGAKKGELVDHINGDTLDNRRANLRICNPLENARNRTTKGKNNTSGYKGVFSSRGRWKVEIGYRGKLKYYGIYNNKEDAATVYNFAIKELFGDFVRYNEVPQPWLEGITSE